MMILENIDSFEKRYRIGILTAPTEQASVVPISNLIEIVKPLSKSIVIITGNAAYNYLIKDIDISSYDNSHPIYKNHIKKIFNYLFAQFRGSWILLKNRNNVDMWIFFMGGEREILPILTAKLLKKPTLLILTGSIVNFAKYSHDPFLIPTKILNRITCNLVNGILLYSYRLIPETGLEKHKEKIFIVQRHFVDFNLFKCFENFDDRTDTIGYIGRLSEEKGVQHFVQALPTILNAQKDSYVFIGGDGPLKEDIKILLTAEKISNHVDLRGWISHDDLPKYLNQLRLLVLPSYTEGLPNIMLEAMACGTPVLATPVGAIPDVIREGETGFIMEDNSPECIAENVIRALNSPDLARIAENGRHLVLENFTFEKTVRRWEKMFNNI
jgi:glycosyltransferase involved in cell wall biosynthesis